MGVDIFRPPSTALSTGKGDIDNKLFAAELDISHTADAGEVDALLSVKNWLRANQKLLIKS